MCKIAPGTVFRYTIYGNDPVTIAKKWESEGGEYLHVVDLDGALKGCGVNSHIIADICSSVNIPVQTGGGIRTQEDIESRFSCGIQRVIIGTSAVRDTDFIKRAADKYADRIIIGIDAKDGMVAIEGWKELSDFTAIEFAKKMESLGIRSFIYTDIATDGTLKGPNVAAMSEMSAAVNANVIASGGIGNIEHIKMLSGTGVEGIITGRALYEGTISLKEAIAAGKQNL